LVVDKQQVCDVEKNADCFSGNVRKNHLNHLINGTVPSSRCKECTKVYILQNEAIQSKPKHTTLDEVLPIGELISSFWSFSGIVVVWLLVWVGRCVRGWIAGLK
jgi:hypothetical protein